MSSHHILIAPWLIKKCAYIWISIANTQAGGVEDRHPHRHTSKNMLKLYRLSWLHIHIFSRFLTDRRFPYVRKLSYQAHSPVFSARESTSSVRAQVNSMVVHLIISHKKDVSAV